MAQPYMQSKAYRNLTIIDIFNLTEEQARERFTIMRWGSLTNIPCPDCGEVDQHYQRRHRHQWCCKHCHRIFSVTSGTTFADRKLSFKILLLIIYEFISSPKGCSANSIHSRYGVTCRTAYQTLSKLREVLFEQMDLTPLCGTIQIDGGHFCGKPRRPRKRRKVTSPLVNAKLRNRKASMVPGQTQIEDWNREKLKKRRIVIVMRQLSPLSPGAARTVVRVVMAESAKYVLPVIRKYVSPNSIIQSDEGHAYTSLSAWYEHRTVRHSVEYATDDGVTNNQAESFIGRLRRAEYGVFHGMRPQYLAFYASEIAWKEDVRCLSLQEKFDEFLRKLFSCGHSKAWRGYFQGHRLGFEYLG